MSEKRKFPEGKQETTDHLLKAIEPKVDCCM